LYYIAQYSCASNTQEILFFGSLLSFHCYCTTSKSIKISTIISFTIFAIGVLLTQYANLGFLNDTGTIIGLICVGIGIIGMIILFIKAIKCNEILQFFNIFTFGDINNQNNISDSKTFSIHFLMINLACRIIIYISYPGNGDNKQLHAQANFIIINSITVLVLSILNARKIKLDFLGTQVSIVSIIYIYIYTLIINSSIRLD
jgi:hypothetical protein